MINYSAGFVRRGLFGEIIQFLNHLVQPFLSEIFLSAISLLFIFYIIITKANRLNVKLIYILAIIFSPSLFLSHRGEEIFRSDAIVMALNFAVSCILLNEISIRRKTTYGGGVKLFSRMFIFDFVILLLLSTSALVHELSFFLLPPVMFLFFIYCKKNHVVLHFIFVLDIILIIYVLMMIRFTFSDQGVIAKSWFDIFGDPIAYRNNGGLTNVVNKDVSPKGPPILLARLPNLPIKLLFNLFIAAAVPFIFLLMSGIKIFYSSSSRSRYIRKTLAIFCMTPILLSPVAGDYGRWFSLCAFSLVVYSLLMAHPARMRYNSDSRRKIVKIKSLAKQTIVLVAAIILVNYQLKCNGFFYKNNQTLFEETKFIAANFQNLTEYIKQLVSRELVITPGGRLAR